MTFAFPAFAFAAEGESEGIGAILPNMTEFIPMLVAFILVAILVVCYNAQSEYLNNLDEYYRQQAAKALS